MTDPTPSPRFVAPAPTEADRPKRAKATPYADQFRTNDDGVQEKYCTKCKEWGPLNGFPLMQARYGAHTKTGHMQYTPARYSSICRKCMDAEAKKSRARLKQIDPMRIQWQNLRGGALRRGIVCPKAPPFKLSEIPDTCPVLGIPLNPLGAGVRAGDGQYRAQRDISKEQSAGNTSFDRIDPDPNIGYASGNLVVISNRANALKRDATPEESLRVAAYSYRESLKRGLVAADPIQDLIDAASKSKSPAIQAAVAAFKKAAFP